MIAGVLLAALELAANPFALVGYLALGAYARTPWQALKYGFLWGLAVHVFALALGNVAFADAPTLALTTALRLVGALIVTVGVFYLARLLGRGGRGGGGAGRPRRAPHLRRAR